MIIIMPLKFLLNELAFHSKEPRLTKIMVASRPNELDADFKENARFAFDE